MFRRAPGGYLYAAGLATVLVATGCTTAERRVVPPVRSTMNGAEVRFEPAALTDSIRVMTLNVAHGRVRKELRPVARCIRQVSECY